MIYSEIIGYYLEHFFSFNFFFLYLMYKLYIILTIKKLTNNKNDIFRGIRGKNS